MEMLKTIGMLALVVLAGCGAAKKNPALGEVAAKSPSLDGTPPPLPPPGPVISKNKVPLFDASHNTRFLDLPLEGSVESSKRLWSGDHWAINRGIINRRWNTPDQAGFDTPSLTKEEILLMSQEDISALAPSEKYDLLMGHYDYPLKKEVAAKSNPLAVYWEGIGNGWASASSNHEEPLPKIIANPDGLMIPFGSSDIKALLSYYYAFASKLPPTLHLGLRCPMNATPEDLAAKCGNDLSPASFHIVLTNKIGLRKQSFLADIDRFQEVWNHPIQAYRSEVLEKLPPSEGSPDGTEETLRMKTRISYVDESVGNSWQPIKGSWRQVTSNRIYNYDLHVDKEGEILGGDWRSNDRPDFIWVMPAVEIFEAPFVDLAKLLN